MPEGLIEEAAGVDTINKTPHERSQTHIDCANVEWVSLFVADVLVAPCLPSQLFLL